VTPPSAFNWITRVFETQTPAGARQRTPSDAFDTQAAWILHVAEHGPLLAARHAEMVAMNDWPAPTFRGYCATCGDMRALGVSWHGTGQAANVREGLACPECRLNARQRAAFGLLRDRVASPDARIYASEQTTPAYAWLRRNYRRSCGSEYGVSAEKAEGLKPWMRSLGVDEPIVHQDVTALTFADASLDGIISFDVLEHVPDYAQALREFARVLAPGGLLVVTVPFIEAHEHTTVRARIGADGQVEHLLPPEMHGDPVSGGVLCFYHFGWDLLATAREAGFAKAEWHRTWAPEHGLFGMWTMLATK
jgi:SAM-dependent methyltransferase